LPLFGRLRRRDPGLEAAFSEFEHYVGDFLRNRERGSVSGAFTTPDDSPEVIDYDTERLRDHGWNVNRGVDDVGLVRVTARRRAQKPLG
jgi:hypothetical protein